MQLHIDRRIKGIRFCSCTEYNTYKLRLNRILIKLKTLFMFINYITLIYIYITLYLYYTHLLRYLIPKH